MVVYEFVGQTGRLIGDESADPVFNSIFNQYVQDDNVYQPDGQLDSVIQNPAVYNTAKCTQVRLGKQCEGQENTPIEDRVCCEGLTMCDFQYSLRYVVRSSRAIDSVFPQKLIHSFILIVVVSVTISDTLVTLLLQEDSVDNAVNVIPITGGVGEFSKAYGEVVISAEYFDPEINSCPNIGEVNLYNIAAKIYVEECEYSNTFFAETGASRTQELLEKE